MCSLEGGLRTQCFDDDVDAVPTVALDSSYLWSRWSFHSMPLGQCAAPHFN